MENTIDNYFNLKIINYRFVQRWVTAIHGSETAEKKVEKERDEEGVNKNMKEKGGNKRGEWEERVSLVVRHHYEKSEEGEEEN